MCFGILTPGLGLGFDSGCPVSTAWSFFVLSFQCVCVCEWAGAGGGWAVLAFLRAMVEGSGLDGVV